MNRRPFIPNRSATLGVLAGAALSLGISAAPAPAQLILKSIPEIENVGIVEHRGTQVPKDIAITDSNGRAVKTGDFFDGRRPVLLVMGYYDCPLLCTLIFNAVQKSLNGFDWTAGVEYRVLFVSIDHTNTPESARLKHDSYAVGMNNAPTDDGFVFTVTDPPNIRRLAETVGYHYKFLPETGEFSHPAALIFLTPAGVINTYMEKLDYPPRDVKLALLEAAEGRTGSIFDRIQHFCFRYNSKEGRYTADAKRVLQLGGLATAGTLGVSIAAFAFAGARRRRQLALGTSLAAAARNAGPAPTTA